MGMYQLFYLCPKCMEIRDIDLTDFTQLCSVIDVSA